MPNIIIKIDPQSLKYITKDPDILGGAAVVKGTRIPVSRIIYLAKEGYTTDMIKEYEYPNLTTDIISGTISEASHILDTPMNEKISPLQTSP